QGSRAIFCKPCAPHRGARGPRHAREVPMSFISRRLLAGAALAASLGAAAPAGAETVRMTVSYYSAATGPYFEKMAAAFHAANPGIDVHIEVVNWSNLLQKLQTDISGNSNADLSIIGTRWLLDFVHDDIAEPLDGY